MLSAALLYSISSQTHLQMGTYRYLGAFYLQKGACSFANNILVQESIEAQHSVRHEKNAM